MSISAYNASVSIPPYPHVAIRPPEAKPPVRDTDRDPPQTPPSAATPDTALPSTGLLNTVV